MSALTQGCSMLQQQDFYGLYCSRRRRNFIIQVSGADLKLFTQNISEQQSLLLLKECVNVYVKCRGKFGAFDTQSVCRGCGAGTHLVVVSFDVCTSGCLHVHGCVLNLPSCFPCIGPSVGFPWLLGGQWGVREVCAQEVFGCCCCVLGGCWEVCLHLAVSGHSGQRFQTTASPHITYICPLNSRKMLKVLANMGTARGYYSG